MDMKINIGLSKINLDKSLEIRSKNAIGLSLCLLKSKKAMKYFTMQEMIASSTADSMNINNEPDCKYKDNIIELVDNYLDPMRLEWADYCSDHGLGSPAIRITSGFRCERLNSAVGGSSTSAHLIGSAADMQPVNGKFEEFKKFILGFFEGWDFDELIIEKNSRGSEWAHFAYKSIKGLKRKKCFSLNVK